MAFSKLQIEPTQVMSNPKNPVTFHTPSRASRDRNPKAMTLASEQNRDASNLAQPPQSPSAAEPTPAPLRATMANWCAQSGMDLRTDGAKIMSSGLGAIVGLVGSVVVTATTSAASFWIAVGLGGGVVAGYLLPTVLSTCCFGISDALAPAQSAAASPVGSPLQSPPGSPDRHIPGEIA
jgi:hypothetical protein